ncbi:MAG TPA: tetratricopeptide repeat protein, partial [Arenibaculum sp.]|nr:tetratricopeptide repeat protein [Arenibaculum sp.]
MTDRSSSPSPAALLVARAQARMADGDAAGAASLLDRALAADAGDPEALFARARIHLMAGEHADAQALLRRGRRSDPSSAPLAFLHGLCLHLLADARAAAGAFADALRLAPDHRDAALFLTRSLRAAGDAAACRRARDDLLARFGDDARLLNEVASDLIEESDEPAAAALLERAMALAPGTPEILHNLGVACARMGLIETAEHLLRTALASCSEARPESAATRATLADVLRQRGRPDDAAALARTLLAQGAQTARAHGVLGTIRMNERNHADGVAHLAASHAAEPGSLP